MTTLLDVKNITKKFDIRSATGKSIGTVHAVNNISFSIAPGETLGLVGESGCGKSTVGKIIIRLIESNNGSIILEEQDITKTPFRKMRPLRQRIQMIFQDPYGSFDPRQRAGDIVAEPLLIHGIGNKKERQEKVVELFERVGLRPDQMLNIPAKFSGGQRQRISIARALSLKPPLIIADEPVSALDVSIQAQIINLMADIQREFGMAYLFIAHDLGIVQHISNRVAVMYLGRIVEIGSTEAIYGEPRHPYTITLMSAVPRPNPRRKHGSQAIPRGELPSPLDPPSGCGFHPRCPIATNDCLIQQPALRMTRYGTQVACHNIA